MNIRDWQYKETYSFTHEKYQLMLNMCLSYVYQKNVKNMLSLNNYVFNIKKTRLMYPGMNVCSTHV